MNRDECALVVSINYLATALSNGTEGIGLPKTMTVDNGPEFAGKTVEKVILRAFHGRIRDELPNIEMYCTLTEVKEKLESWRLDYNAQRPPCRIEHGLPVQ